MPAANDLLDCARRKVADQRSELESMSLADQEWAAALAISAQVKSGWLDSYPDSMPGPQQRYGAFKTVSGIRGNVEFSYAIGFRRPFELSGKDGLIIRTKRVKIASLVRRVPGPFQFLYPSGTRVLLLST